MPLAILRSASDAFGCCSASKSRRSLSRWSLSASSRILVADIDNNHMRYGGGGLRQSMPSCGSDSGGSRSNKPRFQALTLSIRHCNKFVAHPRDSDDQFGPRSIPLQFLTKFVYMHIHSPRECSAVIAPD